MLAVYRRCADAVYRLALSITRDRGTAEDVVQEAFCRVQQRIEALSDADACDGYVYRTARNLALDHVRKRAKASPLEADAVALVDDPGDGLRSSEEAARLSAALLALPDEQREVVLLKVYDALTFARIAALTGAPLGTVQSRYRYGMARLRQLLEGDA